MKTSKITIILLLLSFTAVTKAQYSGFDLSRYKLPDIKVNRLDANLDLANVTNSDHQKMYYNDSTESGTKNFQGSLNLNFYHFRNTESYQGKLQIVANTYLNPYTYTQDDNSYKRNSIDGNFWVTDINRFYNQKLNFIEIDPEISVITNNNKHEYEDFNNQDYSNNQLTAKFSLPVSVGRGRIEPVEDLRLAIYILQELNKVGRIENLPSDNIILNMASVISKIKRQRFFDSRLRKIKELEVIDSFLVANNIVTSNDINYFAVLNDQWDYAAGPVREAGFSIDAGIDDHIIFNRSLAETAGGNPEKTETHINTYDISAFFRARYCKPVNLYWQTTATLITHWGYEFTKNPKDGINPEDNYNTNFFSTFLAYSIQYLPDSRTSVALYMSGNYKNSIGDRILPITEPIVFQMKDNQFNINAGLNMYYYISPKLRLQLNSDIAYSTHHNLYSNDTQPEELKSFSKYLQHDFALTLIYSFF
jgi:hypothetical protein